MFLNFRFSNGKVFFDRRKNLLKQHFDTAIDIRNTVVDSAQFIIGITEIIFGKIYHCRLFNIMQVILVCHIFSKRKDATLFPPAAFDHLQADFQENPLPLAFLYLLHFTKVNHLPKHHNRLSTQICFLHLTKMQQSQLTVQVGFGFNILLEFPFLP